MADRQYCYKTTLIKVYGLTPRLIKMIGQPDKTMPNPHYRSMPSASLYLIERVERWIEAHQVEVERARQARAQRSQRMSDVARRRRDELLAWAGRVGIVVEELPLDFHKRACSYYGESGLSSGALVAFARHNFTNYERLLLLIEGQPGCEEAYPLIKSRVNAAVSDRLAEVGLIERTSAEGNGHV